MKNLKLAMFVVLVSFSSNLWASDDWPGWRGKDRRDISKETGLLQEWPEGGPKQVWLNKDGGLGYAGGAVLFGAGLAVLVGLYFWAKTSHVLLFWLAFILTRPLGATVGDLLDKPIDHGGLDFSRPLASAVLASAILALILILPQRAGEHPRSP